IPDLVFWLGLEGEPPAWLAGHGPGIDLDLRPVWKSWTEEVGAKGGGQPNLIQGGGLSSAMSPDAALRLAAARVRAAPGRGSRAGAARRPHDADRAAGRDAHARGAAPDPSLLRRERVPSRGGAPGAAAGVLPGGDRALRKPRRGGRCRGAARGGRRARVAGA